MTPTISSARLTMRPLTGTTSRQIRWLRDPEVVRYSEQRHLEHTPSTQLRYIHSYPGGSHIWAIHLIETNEHIGNISSAHDGPNNVSDIGMLIGEPSMWGKGYGKEAWGAVCAWLVDKDFGAVRKLEAGCASSNDAMLRIIKGSGFVQEGERKLHFLFDGNPISAVLFGRMR